MTDSYYAFFGEKHPPIRCKKNLLRFQIAQDRDYENALREIKQGQKKSHWIWYVFPQLEGLGSSSMCKKYGIMGLQEAKCYLLHPILTERLVQISKAVHNKLKKRSTYRRIDGFQTGCSKIGIKYDVISRSRRGFRRKRKGIQIVFRHYSKIGKNGIS